MLTFLRRFYSHLSVSFFFPKFSANHRVQPHVQLIGTRLFWLFPFPGVRGFWFGKSWKSWDKKMTVTWQKLQKIFIEWQRYGALHCNNSRFHSLSLTHSITHSLILSFVRSFIHSFIHSAISHQSINQSINHSVNQSDSQSVSQSGTQSTSQSINQSNNQSINQSIFVLYHACWSYFKLQILQHLGKRTNKTLG